VRGPDGEGLRDTGIRAEFPIRSAGNVERMKMRGFRLAAPADTLQTVEPEEALPDEPGGPPVGDPTSADESEPGDVSEPGDERVSDEQPDPGISPDEAAFPGMEALAPTEEERYVEVALWPDDRAPGFRTMETDSTLRWFMALDWNERLYRQPGVFTYRTGRLGHPSGLDIYGYDNNRQRLMVNEMDMTDPVTGQVNWSRLPIHRIRSIRVDDRGWNWRARAELREHYLVQPRTYLNFDEGAGDYRNLEFSFTHNLHEKTNIELAFWDRRDGDRFSRNGLDGRQIVMRARHNLSDRTLLKAGYINNGLNLEQSFGYQIPNPFLYDFNPFNTSPVESGAASNQTTNDLYLQAHQRRDADVDPHRAAGLHYQTNRFRLTYSQDTTAYAMRDLGLFAWQEWRPGVMQLRARGDVNLLSEVGERSLRSDRWLAWRGSLRGRIPLVSGVRIEGEGRLDGRSDGYSGFEFSGSLILQPVERLILEGSAAVGASIPTLQALYWQSADYSGRENLTTERGGQAAVDLRYRISSLFRFGARAGARENRTSIFVDPAGQFVTADPYRTYFGSAWLELDSRILEGEISASARTTETDSEHPVNRLLNQHREQVWLRGSLYWKNYVFNRAAFVKAGASGMISPYRYRPAGYQIPLNRWQHGVFEQRPPDFHRLDLDVSARIRWFMLLIRYENVLDGMGQPGYFETEGYPMPGRRLIVGIRVVFTN